MMALFLGKYDFDGDPDTLLAAYDRMMAVTPAEQISFHTCIRRAGGITIYDTCPSLAEFEAFSTDPQLLAGMAAAGLPAPVVTPLGECHLVRAAAAYVS